MKLKLFFTLAVLVLALGDCFAQVMLTEGAPTATINFSNTMQTTVGTNPSTAYTGAGFSPNPTVAGRLNSNAWDIRGWTFGTLGFGGTQTLDDFGRGAVNGPVLSGGLYAYTELPGTPANPAFMVQATDIDFNPGSIVLKIKNNGATNMTQLAVSYNLFVRNDENRASSFNFSHSLDDLVYIDEPALNYTSPETSDAFQWVSVDVSPSRSMTITGINVAPGAFYYIRWTSQDVSGTGTFRDEFGLDDIVLTATYGPPAPEINVVGSSGVTILSGDTTPSVSEGTDFAPIGAPLSTFSATQSTTYKIMNLGGSNLTVSGVTISGTNAADFAVFTPGGASATTPATGSINPVSATPNYRELTITFDPSAPGLRTAIVSIANNDSNENPYVFYIQGYGFIPKPDINVKGLTGGTSNIASGDMIPSALDNTLWAADQNVGVSVVKDYRIQNTGNVGAPLLLTGTPTVAISGLHPSDFVVTTFPLSNSINAGFGTNFYITFTPSAPGIRSAIVTIANNDLIPDPFYPTQVENPYTFLIQGKGVTPEIDITGNLQPVISGSTTPTLVNHTFYDYLNIATGFIDRTYTIKNNGTVALTIGTVNITGTEAADFTVMTPPSASVAIGGTTTLTIRFNPSAVGVRNATVSIVNNDYNENPYTFAVSGYGLDYIPCSFGSIETIAIQDFEVAPATPTWAYSTSGSTVSNGTAFGLNGDAGLSDRFLGARSLQVTNATSVVNMTGVNTMLYNDIEMNLRLSAFGGTAAEGMDAADKVTVAVSTNNGASYSNELEITGNTDAKWTYASGTAIATLGYDGDATPFVFSPPSGGYLTTTGYSTVSLSGLPKSANLLIRITIVNNNANEIWTVDNVSLFGRKEIFTTWNGSAWDNGVPSPTVKAVFDGDYSTAAFGNVQACKCEIKVGRNVNINTNNHFNIQSDLDNKGTITIENGGSLVQRNDFATNTGSINVKRFTTAMKKFDYTYWSSPVIGQTLFNLSPLTPSDKYYEFSPTAANWIGLPPVSSIMQPAKGYIIRAPQNFSETVPAPYLGAQFAGIANNGFIQTPVTLAASSWNLLGNPYASAIDADLFLGFPANVGTVGGSIYLWTHNTNITNGNYTSNDYAVYNLLGGVGTAAANGGVNNTIPTGNIASGQGFFISATASGVATFNNSMRITGSNMEFFRQSNAFVSPETATDGIEKHRMWLNLSNTEGAFKQTLVGYAENATNGIDRDFDGTVLNGGNTVSFYSFAGMQPLAIQGRALPFDIEDKVKLGYSSTITGVFNIALENTDGILQTQNIYLEDKLLNVIHDLKQTAYTFTTALGTFDERFELRYTTEQLGVGEFNGLGNLVVAVKDNNITLLSSENMTAIAVFDLLGRRVFEAKNINNTHYAMNNVVMNQQTLIVKVTLDAGSVITRKIIF